MYIEYLGEIDPQTLIGGKFNDSRLKYTIITVDGENVVCKCDMDDSKKIFPLESWIFIGVHNGRQFPGFLNERQFMLQHKGEDCIMNIQGLMSEEIALHYKGIDLTKLNTKLTEIYNSGEVRQMILDSVSKKKNGDFSSKGTYEIEILTEFTPNEHRNRDYLALVAWGSDKDNYGPASVSVCVCTRQKAYKKK